MYACHTGKITVHVSNVFVVFVLLKDKINSIIVAIAKRAESGFKITYV